MFNTKRIKELESRVDSLEQRVKELVHRVAEQDEEIKSLLVPIVPERGEGLVENAKYVNELIKDLVAFDNVINLDDEHFSSVLERSDIYEQDFLLGMKNEYEKRLKKFILKCNSQRKNPKKNGKENPKASE